MSITVTDHIKNFSREVGFNWKKALRLALLGVVLGLVLALVVPLRVS